MKQKRLPRFGLPKRILIHASDKEMKEIYEMCDKRDYRYRWPSADPLFENRKRAAWEAMGGLTGIRKILRKRYSESFKEGVYSTVSKNTEVRMTYGKFGTRYAGRIPKGTVLVWIERDEIGNNWFMHQDHIITITGVQLDKVVRLE